MKNKTAKILFFFASLALPSLAFAFPSTIGGVIEMLTGLGLALIPLLGAVAFLVFIYEVARFIKAAGNEKEIKDSKNLLIYGVIGLFVLVTIWGIVSFLRGEAGFGGGVGIPQIRF